MATSVIEICNNALLALGADTITSLGDASENARRCNQRWPSVRDAVLREHPWNFAVTMTDLASNTDSPAYKWDYSYTLPSDIIRILEIVDSSEAAIDSWEVQGRDIMCNAAAPIYIKYVRREEDPQKYDALFSEACSARLAAELAYPVTGSSALFQAMTTIYQNKLSAARGVDAREGVADSVNPTTWLTAKLGGSRNF